MSATVDAAAHQEGSQSVPDVRGAKSCPSGGELGRSPDARPQIPGYRGVDPPSTPTPPLTPVATGPLAVAARRLRARPGRKSRTATAGAHSGNEQQVYLRKKPDVPVNRAEAEITSGLPYSLLTIREAACYLRCSTWLVRQMLQGGYLTPIRLPVPITARRRSAQSRKLLIDRAEIDRLITQERRAS